MGKRRRGWGPSRRIASARSTGNPFYDRLDRVLDEAGFDALVEEQRAEFGADGGGRPSLALDRYCRMLLFGCFEGLDSEAIAWRAVDSLSLRESSWTSRPGPTWTVDQSKAGPRASSNSAGRVSPLLASTLAGVGPFQR